MRQDEFINQIADTFQVILHTIEKKNHDYTAGSADPLTNFRDPELQEILTQLNINMSAIELGIRNRLKDKWKRLNTAIFLGEYKVSNESFDDTVQDAIAYLAILKVARKERLELEKGSDVIVNKGAALTGRVPEATERNIDKALQNLRRDSNK